MTHSYLSLFGVIFVAGSQPGGKTENSNVMFPQNH